MTDSQRTHLKQLLEQWGSGSIDEVEVHETAEQLWETLQQAEANYPEQDPRSIAIEVLSQLEILNHQLITKVDIPAILAFLETPPGEEQTAWKTWRQYWENLDLAARKDSLKSHPYYASAVVPAMPLTR